MSHFISAGTAGTRAKFSLLLLGSVAGVVAVGTASAADVDAPRLAVKYSQKSLATDSGVQDLYRRITLAARKVCPEDSVRDFSVQRQVQQCRDEAVARAIRQVDNSRLAALYAAHSKNG
jgi:UrcA family protein